MKNLPVEVSDEDIDEMFEFADKNKDGKLSYKEFKESIKEFRKYDFFKNIPEKILFLILDVKTFALIPDFCEINL